MASTEPTPILYVTPETWEDARARIGEMAFDFAQVTGFEAKPGQWRLLPTPAGKLAGVIFGADPDDPFAVGKLASNLPPGKYHFAEPPPDAELAALSFLLARYKFNRFKSGGDSPPDLVPSEGIDFCKSSSIVAAVNLGRISSICRPTS